MLTSERIKEAEQNTPKYLLDGLLKKRPTDTDILNRYLKNARESFAVAEHLCNERHSALWTIVTSYYSMFYAANAYLCKLGLKIEDKIVHKITADTLIVYARQKLQEHITTFETLQKDALELTQADDIIDSYDKEKAKRSRFQYQMIIL